MTVSSPQDGGYARSYTYDAACREIGVTISDNGYSGTYAIGYDPATTKVSTTTYPDGLVASTVYACPPGATNCPNTAGYVSATMIQPPGGTSQNFEQVTARDAEGRVTGSTSADGVATVRRFDANTGDLLSIQSGPAGSATSVQNIAYGYDGVHNTTARNSYITVGGTNYLTAETLGYDLQNRLRELDLTNGNWSGSEVYDYDAIGNMIYRSDLGTMTYGAPATGGVPAGQHGLHQLQTMKLDQKRPDETTAALLSPRLEKRS